MLTRAVQAKRSVSMHTPWCTTSYFVQLEKKLPSSAFALGIFKFFPPQKVLEAWHMDWLSKRDRRKDSRPPDLAGAAYPNVRQTNNSLNKNFFRGCSLIMHLFWCVSCRNEACPHWDCPSQRRTQQETVECFYTLVSLSNWKQLWSKEGHIQRDSSESVDDTAFSLAKRILSSVGNGGTSEVELKAFFCSLGELSGSYEEKRGQRRSRQVKVQPILLE